MANNITLLEMIAEHLNLPYLSDLHELRRADASQAITVYYLLSKVQPENFELDQWNEALAYVAGLNPVDNPASAHKALLDYFYSRMK